MAAMVVQLGLAMIPSGRWARAWGFTSATTSGTSGSLRQAEEKLALAQAAMQDEDFKQARLYAEQAELDARLAEAEHLTEKSQQQLAELTNAINRLRKQLGGLQ